MHVYVGWWLAVVDNMVGWVPSSFLEPLEGEIEDFVKEASKEVEISSGEDTEAGSECPVEKYLHMARLQRNAFHSNFT